MRPNTVFSAACRLRKTQYRPKADSASYRTTAIIAPACCSSITLAAASGGIANDTSRSLPPNAPIASGQYIVDATGQADFNHRSAGRCYGRISGHMRGNGIGCFDIDLRYLAHHILNIACPRRACRRYRHISQLNVGGQNNVTPSNRAGGHHHRLGLHHGQYGFNPKQHCESHAQRSSESAQGIRHAPSPQ